MIQTIIDLNFFGSIWEKYILLQKSNFFINITVHICIFPSFSLGYYLLYNYNGTRHFFNLINSVYSMCGVLQLYFHNMSLFVVVVVLYIAAKTFKKM